MGKKSERVAIPTGVWTARGEQPLAVTLYVHPAKLNALVAQLRHKRPDGKGVRRMTRACGVLTLEATDAGPTPTQPHLPFA